MLRHRSVLPTVVLVCALAPPSTAVGDEPAAANRFEALVGELYKEVSGGGNAPKRQAGTGKGKGTGTGTGTGTGKSREKSREKSKGTGKSKGKSQRCADWRAYSVRIREIAKLVPRLGEAHRNKESWGQWLVVLADHVGRLRCAQPGVPNGRVRLELSFVFEGAGVGLSEARLIQALGEVEDPEARKRIIAGLLSNPALLRTFGEIEDDKARQALVEVLLTDRQLLAALGKLKDREVIRRAIQILTRLLDEGGPDPSQVDPKALSACLEDLVGTTEGELDEILALSRRLQDPALREAFVARLERLGLQGDEARGIRQADNPPDLLKVLLRAERAVIAAGTEFTRFADDRAGVRHNAGWLKLVVEAGDLSTASTDFVQALKELLTGTTGEGIALTDTCECSGMDCGAAVCVRLVAAEDASVQPLGRLRFNPTSYYEPGPTAQEAPESPEVTGPAFPRCNEPVPAGLSPGVEATMRERCLTEQIHAAHAFMNALSDRFSIFGERAFMRPPRRADRIAPALHPGVRVIDMFETEAKAVPGVYKAGLGLVDDKCEGGLGTAMAGRLRISYADLVGPVTRPATAGDSAGSSLTLSPDPEGCRVRLRDPDGVLAYHALVQGGPPEAAGEDAARALGSFYGDVRAAWRMQAESAWASRFFAGGPMLADDDPDNDALGHVLTAADLVSLLCVAGSVGGAVYYRNGSEEENEASVKRANVMVGTAFACLGMSITARILGAALAGDER